MAGGSRSRSTTKGLLICGFAAAALYVVGDIVSGFAYKSARPYSFKDQWISELTARAHRCGRRWLPWSQSTICC